MGSVFGRVALFIGFILFVAGIILVVMNAIEVNQLHAIASSQRSRDFFNPNGRIVVASVVAMGSGLLIGLGIAASIAARRRPQEVGGAAQS